MKQYFVKQYWQVTNNIARRSAAALTHDDEKALADLLTGSYYTEEVLGDTNEGLEQAIHETYLVQQHLADMNANDAPWTADEADWVIPGPWTNTSCFYFDLHTGEAIAYKDYAVGGDLILTAEDLEKHWEKVDAADHAELKQFVDNKVFELAAKKDAGSNRIDAVWIRRWKWETTSKDWIIKSRMCGRGFLDKQKFDVQKHSATASRLSQRFLCSLCVQHDLKLESWDIF